MDTGWPLEVFVAPSTKQHSFRLMKSRIVSAVLALTLCAQHGLCAGNFDWPQWQGLERTAHSKETGLLKEWPKDGPPLAWKTKGLGGGDSAPSVAAGRIYGMSHRGQDEMVWALSEKDGKEVWAVRLGPAFPTSWPQSKEGPSATPTVDGDQLYVMGLAGNLVCLQGGRRQGALATKSDGRLRRKNADVELSGVAAC
jgi:hypothetical protein